MSLDLVLTVVCTLALFAVIVAAVFGVVGSQVRAAESDAAVAESDAAVERLRAGEVTVVGDEVGDDVITMLAAWRNEARR